MALGKPMLMAHLPFLFAHPTHPKKCVFSPGGVLVARDYEPLTPAGVSGAAGLGGCWRRAMISRKIWAVSPNCSAITASCFHFLALSQWSSGGWLAAVKLVGSGLQDETKTITLKQGVCVAVHTIARVCQRQAGV